MYVTQLIFFYNFVLFYSQHSSRVFVNNKEARKLLFTFADTGLEEQELQYLRDLMQLYQPALVDFIEQCIENGMKKPPILAVELL